MNNLDPLEALGLVLPTPWYIVGAILFGLIGIVVFRRGKTASNTALKWTGVALMLYPYALSETWMLWLTGLALCGLTYAKWD